MAAPIRVMVVDDSVAVRGLLSRVIDAQPDMTVVASAPNGRAALELLRLRPVEVVLLDVEMPEMDGLTALPLIQARHPHVRVIMTSSLTQRGAQTTVRALALGAADYVAKPTAGPASLGIAAMRGELVAKVRALAATARCAAAAALDVAPAPDAAAALRRPPIRRVQESAGLVRLVAIAASTGGPNALSRLLSELPATFSLPIIVTQHMPPVFTSALAERLARDSGRPCLEARSGEPLRTGHSYIAPGGFHLLVDGTQGQPVLRLSEEAPVHHCRPAADPMFRSAAALFGGGVLAVVLTGMGEDGLQGCREVVARGGRVVVQDQATSTVWGMPGAVFHAGLASAVLPIERMAAHVVNTCGLPAHG